MRERHRTGRPRRTWGQRLAIAGGCASTVGLLASATGLSYAFRKYERLPRVELSGALTESEGSDEPENYLLVGIDNASDLPADDSVRIGRDPTDLRSDTIMVLRIDPASRRPRCCRCPATSTSRWPRHGRGPHQPRPALRRPRPADPHHHQNFGIQINHYVQVDFA